MPVAVRSVHKTDAVIFRPEARRKVGASDRKMSFWGRNLNLIRKTGYDPTASGVMPATFEETTARYRKLILI